MSNINEIMSKHLMGTATEEEEALLREYADPDTVREILQADDLAERYDAYSQVDVEKALESILQRGERKELRGERKEERGVRKEERGKVIFRIAAAILVLVVAGAMLWYRQYTKVTPPELSEAVQMAMRQSDRNGKSEATIDKSFLPEEIVRGEYDPKVVRQGQDNSQEGEGQTADDSSISQISFLYSSLTKSQLLEARRLTTRHDKEFWLTLDDGTLVHLNYNSRLIYPERFGRDDRNVILDGEAYFMVAKDKSRPFIVHTPQGDVKVLGTEFVVNTNDLNDQDEPSTTITLVKGSVSVTPNSGTERVLKPGQQLKLMNNQLTVNEVDTTPFVAWNNGTFVFENCTLMRLMSVLSKWYGYHVTFESKQARTIRFTGELDKYSSIEPALEAIEQVTGLDIELHQERIIIK